jgi:cysteinyl-tRNA synthetase
VDSTQLPVAPREWPSKVRDLVTKRESVRQSGDFEAADKLRGEVEAQGFRLEDTPGGPRLYRQ